MSASIELHGQAPIGAGVDLGLRMASLIIGKPMAMSENHLRHLIETISANRFVLPRDRDSRARITEKGTAIVEVHGVLLNRFPILGSWYGLSAYETLTEQLRRLATNKDVQRIILDLDSPGGLVTGIRGCAEAIEKLAEKKPVYALAHDQADSAAYWLACCAKEISITVDGEVGSIGVRGGHVSYADQLERAGVEMTLFSAGAAKNDGMPYGQLTAGEASEKQFEIDRAYSRFVEHVAKHRPLSDEEVRATDARVFTGEDAVAAKLADRVESLDEMVERLESGKPSAAKSSAPLKSSPQTVAVRNPARPAASASGAQFPKGAINMSTQNEAGAHSATADQIATAAIEKFVAAQKAAAAAPAKTEAEIREEASKATAERISAIIGCDEAKGREDMARSLAFDPEFAAVSVDAIKKMLATAPAAVSADAGSADDKAGGGFQTALAKKMAESGKSGGIKPVDGKAATAEGRGLVDHMQRRFGSAKKEA